MSPHRIEVIPSVDSLSQYRISKNGFLPAEPPLSRLPHHHYQPWEYIIEELPFLVEKQLIRAKVDQLPVLETTYLSSEAEWQRAYSILSVIAQGYIWTGPEPSEVSVVHTSGQSWGTVADDLCSGYLPQSLSRSCERPNASKYIP